MQVYAAKLRASITGGELVNQVTDLRSFQSVSSFYYTLATSVLVLASGATTVADSSLKVEQNLTAGRVSAAKAEVKAPRDFPLPNLVIALASDSGSESFFGEQATFELLSASQVDPIVAAKDPIATGDLSQQDCDCSQVTSGNSFVSLGLPGDFNCDGVVDGADFCRWQLVSRDFVSLPTQASLAKTLEAQFPMATPVSVSK